MKIKPESLQEAAVQILKGLKAGEEEALLVAKAMIKADARGIDTHGLHLLTLMDERVEAGMVNIPTPLKLLSDEGAIALLDGGNGLGQVAAQKAMALSIAKAEANGIGVCLARNTNNIGMLSLYSQQAAEAGMVGMVMANAAASMSAWGGAEALLGTNPISIGIPGGNGPAVLLDMSSSLVARGKIRRAARQKEAIPLGWALDKEGLPTADPEAALKGSLLPIGGPKGYGLALAVDIIAGLISGAQYGQKIQSFHELKGPTGVGVFTLAMDIKRFMSYDQFEGLIRSYVTKLKASRKAPGVERIYLPGEIEIERERESFQQGVEVNSSLVDKLNRLLGKFGSALRLKES